MFEIAPRHAVKSLTEPNCVAGRRGGGGGEAAYEMYPCAESPPHNSECASKYVPICTLGVCKEMPDTSGYAAYTLLVHYVRMDIIIISASGLMFQST